MLLLSMPFDICSRNNFYRNNFYCSTPVINDCYFTLNPIPLDFLFFSFQWIPVNFNGFSLILDGVPLFLFGFQFIFHRDSIGFQWIPFFINTFHWFSIDSMDLQRTDEALTDYEGILFDEALTNYEGSHFDVFFVPRKLLWFYRGYQSLLFYLGPLLPGWCSKDSFSSHGERNLKKTDTIDIQLDSNAFQWISSGFQWTPMDFNGFQLIFNEIHWFSMGCIDLQWTNEALNDCEGILFHDALTGYEGILFDDFYWSKNNFYYSNLVINLTGENGGSPAGEVLTAYKGIYFGKFSCQRMTTSIPPQFINQICGAIKHMSMLLFGDCCLQLACHIWQSLVQSSPVWYCHMT